MAYQLDYKPAEKDKTLWAFMRSQAEIRGIMGPVGSGKTSLCLLEGLRRSVQQLPSPLDGVRYTRQVTVRESYRQLERTTIPDWLSWVPKDEAGTFTGGSSGEPAKHIITFPMRDGSRVHFEHWFAALGDKVDIESFWRGLHTTFIYVNEADTMDIDVINVGRTRLGRYPAMRHGGPTWRGLWCDFNAPNWGDPICDMMIEFRDPHIDFFEQPGGRHPLAENVANLPPKYYEQQIQGQDDYWIARFVDNEIGHSREGKAVYPEFGFKLHVSERELDLLAYRPLYFGLDAGRTPAAAPLQKDYDGQLRFYREMVRFDMGATQFGRDLRQHIADYFPGEDVIGICDPAAASPDQSSGADDEAWMDIVGNEAEIQIREAPSQNPTDRREALRVPMQRVITPERPGLIIDPRSKFLIRGLQHGYRYKRIQGAKGLYRDKPEKNEFSHIVEAAEYGALEASSLRDVRNRRRRRAEKRRPSTTHWRPTHFQ